MAGPHKSSPEWTKVWRDLLGRIMRSPGSVLGTQLQRAAAATIPASCLQYHNPSWSLSLSESPSVFIFPLKGTLLRLGAGGVVTLPVMDGSSWPPVPQPPVHFHLGTSLPPKTGKGQARGLGWGAVPIPDPCNLQNIPKPSTLQEASYYSTHLN